MIRFNRHLVHENLSLTISTYKKGPDSEAQKPNISLHDEVIFEPMALIYNTNPGDTLSFDSKNCNNGMKKMTSHNIIISGN